MACTPPVKEVDCPVKSLQGVSQIVTAFLAGPIPCCEVLQRRAWQRLRMAAGRPSTSSPGGSSGTPCCAAGPAAAAAAAVCAQNWSTSWLASSGPR